VRAEFVRQCRRMGVFMVRRHIRLVGGVLSALLFVAACAESVSTESPESAADLAVDAPLEVEAEPVDPFTVTELLSVPERWGGFVIRPMFDGVVVQPRFDFFTTEDQRLFALLTADGELTVPSGHIRWFQESSDRSSSVLPSGNTLVQEFDRVLGKADLKVIDDNRREIATHTVTYPRDFWSVLGVSQLNRDSSTLVVFDTSRLSRDVLWLQVFDTETLTERASFGLARPSGWSPVGVHVSRDGSTLWFLRKSQISTPDGPNIRIRLEAVDLVSGKSKPESTLFSCGGGGLQPCVSEDVGVTINDSAQADRLWIVINPDVKNPQSPATLFLLDTATGSMLSEMDGLPGLMRVGVDQATGAAWTLSESADAMSLVLQPIDDIALEHRGEAITLPARIGTQRKANRGLLSRWWAAVDSGDLRTRIFLDTSKAWFAGLHGSHDVQVDLGDGSLTFQPTGPYGNRLASAITSDGSREVFEGWNNSETTLCVLNPGRRLELGHGFACAEKNRLVSPELGAVRDIVMSPDDQTAWVHDALFQESTGSSKARGHLVDVNRGRLITSVNVKGEPNPPTWSPDSRFIWLPNATLPRIDIFDAQRGAIATTLKVPSPPGFPSRVKFSPDGKFAIVSMKHPESGGSFPGMIWLVVDTETFEIFQPPFPLAGSTFRQPSFSAEGSRLWAGEGTTLVGLDVSGASPDVRIDLPQGDGSEDPECGGREVVAVTTDPERTWVNAWCGRLWVTDVETGTFVREFDLEGEIQEVQQLPGTTAVLVLTTTTLYRIAW